MIKIIYPNIVIETITDKITYNYDSKRHKAFRSYSQEK